MFTRIPLITAALIATVGLACPESAMAKGPPIRVEQSVPDEAVQGQTGLAVKIIGKNFGPGAQVRFLDSVNGDDHWIEVKSVEYDPETGDLDTVIDVDGEAIPTTYDIEVYQNGRGGKGTDLFRVRAGDVRIADLEITYEFGTLTGGFCIAQDCQTTTIIATGTVECGNLYCDFNSTSVVDDFYLPPGLRELLNETEWRRTPLDADQCFGFTGPGTAGTAWIINTVLFLRRFDDGVTPWYASVGTRAYAVDGNEVRQHIFNFEGCGPGGDCGTFDAGMMDGVYDGGELLHIYSHGNDRKFESIPCRCTRSNTPDCPDDVPVPTPQIRIKVKEVVPLP